MKKLAGLILILATATVFAQKPDLKPGNAAEVREALKDHTVAADVMSDLKGKESLKKPEAAALKRIAQGYVRTDPAMASNAMAQLHSAQIDSGGNWLYVRAHGTKADLDTYVAAVKELNADAAAKAAVHTTMRLGIPVAPYFEQLLGRGVIANTQYRSWFVRRLAPLPIPTAISVTQTELRAALARGQSSAGDLWVRDLRAQLLILKEMSQ